MSRFPGGAEFAFTILDDTDDATLENAVPVYDLLRDLGFRTTKTAWPLDCLPEEMGQYYAGQTLQDPAYLAWVRRLVAEGFELASHNATMASNRRERTEAGLAAFRAQFGFVPTLHANHAQNRENLYWGPARYRNPLIRGGIRVAHRRSGIPAFDGEDERSPYFWGDIAHTQFRYVRSFTYGRLDVSRLGPGGPYRDADTPWVQQWFITADAPDAAAFRRVVTRDAIDALRRSGGYAIISTHIGKGFAPGGTVDPVVADILRYIAGLPGWFVPVSTLLDHLVAERGGGDRWITRGERFRLEMAHAVDRIAGRVLS